MTTLTLTAHEPRRSPGRRLPLEQDPRQGQLFTVPRTLPRGKVTTTRKQAEDVGPLFRPAEPAPDPLPFGQVANEDATDEANDRSPGVLGFEGEDDAGHLVFF